jgi:hypothetical protein
MKPSDAHTQAELNKALIDWIARQNKAIKELRKGASDQLVYAQSVQEALESLEIYVKGFNERINTLENRLNQ